MANRSETREQGHQERGEPGIPPDERMYQKAQGRLAFVEGPRLTPQLECLEREKDGEKKTGARRSKLMREKENAAHKPERIGNSCKIQTQRTETT